MTENHEFSVMQFHLNVSNEIRKKIHSTCVTCSEVSRARARNETTERAWVRNIARLTEFELSLDFRALLAGGVKSCHSDRIFTVISSLLSIFLQSE